MEQRIHRCQNDYCTAGSTHTHHCHIIETGNESFRYKQSTANAKIRIQQREKEKYSPEENLVNL